jgi:predicted transcriptional regulator
MARYTIDMDDKFEKLLEGLAQDKGRTKAEIIRRAVATYSYLDKEVSPDRKVSITTKNDDVVKDIVLP